MSKKSSKYVRRYTTLSSALDTLQHHQLVLLNPEKWDDQNDIHFMELFRNKMNAGSIVALCCTQATETYHHWRIFTQGMEGICLEFDREKLEQDLQETKGVTSDAVDYLLVKELKALSSKDSHRLPYIKREGFSDECEWRVVLTCEDKDVETKPVPIKLSSLNRVLVNPWLPYPLVQNLRRIIKNIPGCEAIKIERSLLTNSRQWKSAGQVLMN